MASNTENLNLLMKNPSTDGADTFNVQTMLNENWQKIDNNAGTVAQTLANILKPTTPPIIGLPPSTTPDGMFQALGNTGELHVWRKTVTTAQEIPAGYTLGSEQSGEFLICPSDGQTYNEWTVSSAISVDDSGNATLQEPSKVYITGTSDGKSKAEASLRGKFGMVTLMQNGKAGYFRLNKLVFFPSTAIFTLSGNSLTVNKYQDVQTNPYIPAGTTTTYPVSTNPNAYQEGDDAKEAGYVLGDVVNTTLVIAYRLNTVCNFSYSDALYVADDGSISLSNPTSGTAGGSYIGAPTYLSGKFLKFVSISGNGGTTLKEGVIYYIPSNATIKIGSYAGYVDAEIDRYQPVTGYAAIPAGTTIEYLGKLGDKARVQVVSYVGTGTYGSSNPNSLTFDFAPKMVIVNGHHATASYTNSYSIILSPQSGDGVSMLGTNRGYVYWVMCEVTDRTVSWYADSDSNQLNKSGIKFTAIAIG